MTQNIWEFLDGKPYTLDGVSGVFEYTQSTAKNGLVTNTLSHNPDEQGQNTAEYQAVKQQLGDDYTTELTWSDRIVDVALELGYKQEKQNGSYTNTGN